MIAEIGQYSGWVKELDRNLPIRRQFVLHGNVHDAYPWKGQPLPLRRFLESYLKTWDFSLVGFIDGVDGASFDTQEERKAFEALAPSPVGGRTSQPSGSGVSFVESVSADLNRVRASLKSPLRRSAFVLDLASLLVGRPDDLSEPERLLFSKVFRCSQEAVKAEGPPEGPSNLLFLVAQKLNDLPAWLYLGNPYCLPIEIGLPSDDERRLFLRNVIRSFHGGRVLSEADAGAAADHFADVTSGMMTTELWALRRLSVQRGIDVATKQARRELLQMFKFGVRDSPWHDPNKKIRLKKAAEELRCSVRGQEPALSLVIDILKRAHEGLSGAQAGPMTTRPKGVLFFAGPTGVGKTEMAKALAGLLFGDRNACVRFDMSEYAQEHADQKLFGAPPGYVGYTEGGQLTNRVKANPFSVLLFDEIEKAHPRILDKFLQILDDGRLTSGQGETVHFSECLVIFTSNKGIYEEELDPRTGRRSRVPVVRPEGWLCRCGELDFARHAPDTCNCADPQWQASEIRYEVVRDRVLDALRTYFIDELGRPELYNRIGNNFVVFDFIRKPTVTGIVEKILTGIAEELETKRKISIVFSSVAPALVARCSGDLDMGGRGIGNRIETDFVNPLGRWLFDNDVRDGSTVVADSLSETAGPSDVQFRLVSPT